VEHGAWFVSRYNVRATRYASLLVLFLFLVSFIAVPAHAQTVSFQQTKAFPKTQLNETPLVSSKEPVLLSADRVDYDREHDSVIATGHVEIAQGASIVLADVVTYDIAEDVATASGDVSVLNPTGDVYFADELELGDNMKSGVIDQLKGRLADNSNIVAAKAHKIDEQHMELFKAAYTPCKCEDEDEDPKTPSWNIKAGYAMMDQQEQEIRYNDATFDALGVPIIYTPYFSNPTPGAPNESGLLMPTFMQSTNIGAVYKQPVYYAIAPDRDLTLTPWYTTLNGPVLGGEYRQKFDSGLLDLMGSAADATAVAPSGGVGVGHELRGNIDGHGDFKINDNYDWGFSIRRASDDTYLQLYNISSEAFLISKV
jgi:LPS-assembly protein